MQQFILGFRPNIFVLDIIGKLFVMPIYILLIKTNRLSNCMQIYSGCLWRSVPALSRQSLGDGFDRGERRPLLREEATAAAGGRRKPSHIRMQARWQVYQIHLTI